MPIMPLEDLITKKKTNKQKDLQKRDHKTAPPKKK